MRTDTKEPATQRATLGTDPVQPEPDLEALLSSEGQLGEQRPPAQALGRIQPVQVPAASRTGDPTMDRLLEIVALTRRQLKALYQRFQESQHSDLPSGDVNAEIGALHARLERIERAVARLDQRPGAATSGGAPTQNDERRLGQNALDCVVARANSNHRAQRIDRFLRLMVERGASDMHLSVGCAPMFRDSGDIEPLRYRRLLQEDWDRLLKPITPPPLWESYQHTGDADFAYEIPDIGRFRVNVFRQERGGGAVFRVIPTKILTIEQLALPDQVQRIAHIKGGLVLVTGPTGSGKSTTLAAIVDKINSTRCYHVVTLEDPIEFVHANKRSLIHQREIGSHAVDFSRGLRDAVREDPNLLLVGEMRDVETIRLALESAEKGLLVFGTLHTNNAAKTVDRIINSFPADEQESIRSVLADTVRAILAQQLLKKVGGGRVAAVEILFGSPALSNTIREGKTHQITSLIQMGQRQGMISMDESLKQLLNAGAISRDAAFEKAIDKSLFRDPAAARLEDEAARAARA